MNLKQLGILFVLVVVLGGAGLVLHRNQNASWKVGDAETGKKLLGDFPVNEVTHISIRQGTNELNLVRKDDLWRVRERNDYPANFSKISEFLLKARDLKVVQSERVVPSQLTRLQLAAPGQGTNSALTVEFKGQNDKPLKTLLLGKQHTKKPGRPSQSGEDDPGWPDGRYVKTDGSETVAVISDPLESIEPKPDAWLNKDFLRMDRAKTVEVTFPNATNSWRLTRDAESGGWRLADAKPGEELDSSKAAGVSSPLSSPSFRDVFPGRKLEGTGANQPTVLRVDTFDQFKYTIRIGQKTNDDYAVTVAVAAHISRERAPGKDEKPGDKEKLDKEFKEKQQKLEDKLKQEQSCEGWTYLVQSWSLDPVLKERSQLLVEKKAELRKDDDVSADAGGHPGDNQEMPGLLKALADPGKPGATNSPPNAAE